MDGFLQDTSVFVAREQGRPLAEAPLGDGRVSVATLTELDVGVRRSRDPRVRAERALTLADARRFLSLSYDEAVGLEVAGLVAAAADAGRRAGAMDAIIAATALVHDLVVWTQDDDFEVLQELAPQLRVQRD